MSRKGVGTSLSRRQAERKIQSIVSRREAADMVDKKRHRMAELRRAIISALNSHDEAKYDALWQEYEEVRG